jgi:GR25 family glycosyltransferase involved in LPS biosynthesis
MDLYVIHLEERPERFEQIKKNYLEYHIIPIHAIRHEIGRIGCFLSHQKCIRLAKEANMKYICVLEDDCVPIGTASHLLDIKDFLENNDWNLFIGGGTGVWDDHVIRKIRYNKYDLFEITKVKTTHMICYHESVYDFFLSIDPYEVDIPIDKIWHNHFRAIIPVPFIATQSNGYSDIEKKEVFVDDKIKICNRYITKFCNLKFT